MKAMSSRYRRSRSPPYRHADARERDRERQRERDRSRSRSRERARERSSHGRERSRDRGRERERGRETEREQERETGRERERGRETYLTLSSAPNDSSTTAVTTNTLVDNAAAPAAASSSFARGELADALRESVRKQQQGKETLSSSSPLKSDGAGGSELAAEKKKKRRLGRHSLADDGGGDDRYHWSQKRLEDMTARDWRIFLEDFDIRVTTRGGGGTAAGNSSGQQQQAIPRPFRSWDESGLPAPLLRVVAAVAYRAPTPIQRQAIPIAMQGRDCIGIAETGSGKTVSFLFPILIAVAHQAPAREEPEMGPHALILAPTRELAQQIEREAKKFADPFAMDVVSVVGGHDMGGQLLALQNGADIIIATPGRLKDVLERKGIVLDRCRMLVMDEADRMVDMGFEKELTFILDALPKTPLLGLSGSDSSCIAATTTSSSLSSLSSAPFSSSSSSSSFSASASSTTALSTSATSSTASASSVQQTQLGRTRQTTMFSATMPPALERIARKYLAQPVMVTVGTLGKAVDTVTQIVEMVPEPRKRNRLLQLLDEWSPPLICFVNTKAGADILGRFVESQGYKATVLHGGKAQEDREANLDDLKLGKKDLLIATDVAARGIDVKDVSLVINFEMAKNMEDYTHRIGRTGRAGKEGTAITFLTQEDESLFLPLKEMLSKSSKSKIPNELSNYERDLSRKERM